MLFTINEIVDTFNFDHDQLHSMIDRGDIVLNDQGKMSFAHATMIQRYQSEAARSLFGDTLQLSANAIFYARCSDTDVIDENTLASESFLDLSSYGMNRSRITTVQTSNPYMWAEENDSTIGDSGNVMILVRDHDDSYDRAWLDTYLLGDTRAMSAVVQHISESQLVAA